MTWWVGKTRWETKAERFEREGICFASGRGDGAVLPVLLAGRGAGTGGRESPLARHGGVAPLSVSLHAGGACPRARRLSRAAGDRRGPIAPFLRDVADGRRREPICAPPAGRPGPGVLPSRPRRGLVLRLGIAAGGRGPRAAVARTSY